MESSSLSSGYVIWLFPNVGRNAASPALSSHTAAGGSAVSTWRGTTMGTPCCNQGWPGQRLPLSLFSMSTLIFYKSETLHCLARADSSFFFFFPFCFIALNDCFQFVLVPHFPYLISGGFKPMCCLPQPWCFWTTPELFKAVPNLSFSAGSSLNLACLKARACMLLILAFCPVYTEPI